MIGKDSMKSTSEKTAVMPFLHLGEAGVALQRELVAAYEEASRAWLARVRTEAALWSEAAAKLSTTRSLSEAVDTYTAYVSQQMKATAEDGRRIFKDCQQITEKVTKSLANRWPSMNS